ncbi:hypothetical protein [Kamptonema sp. UHCC 0994]|uniref:hypothetical protein n=1 Tax=Kamptonema sp. UHCC 0994 TaxID=3031329 RepID=UPI0023B90637|nr:hypothetical protein [Kamptonema sp. UHCC 0994]MDF0554551.1 hypothetical protein [Kamptonema sp. UHCC 0994]
MNLRILTGLILLSVTIVPLNGYRFLGKDIDFGKAGAIIEVQFSHYALWTVYNAQTSRTILTQEERQCQIIAGRFSHSQCRLHIL